MNEMSKAKVLQFRPRKRPELSMNAFMQKVYRDLEAFRDPDQGPVDYPVELRPLGIPYGPSPDLQRYLEAEREANLKNRAFAESLKKL